MEQRERIWECKIGGLCNEPPKGADLPMRQAARHAFKHLTGSEPEFIFSGWGGSLTEAERAAHEDREPSEEHYKQWLLQRAAPDLLKALQELLEAAETDARDLPGHEYGAIVEDAKTRARAAISKATT